MRLIFDHTDGDGDRVKVTADPEQIFIKAPRGAILDREEAQRLHNALGEWLHPQDLGPSGRTLEAAIKTLTDAVNGVATSVRPLWSNRSTYVDAKPEPTINPCGCHDSDGYSVIVADSQNPHCIKCTHPWTRHNLQGCQHDLCICTEPRADRAGNATAPECAHCGHPYADHVTRQEYACTRYRSAP